jgi:hypothetical protein
VKWVLQVPKAMQVRKVFPEKKENLDPRAISDLRVLKVKKAMQVRKEKKAKSVPLVLKGIQDRREKKATSVPPVLKARQAP